MKRFFLLLCLVLLTPKELPAAEYSVAYDATWPPFEFMDKNGRVVGFTVDYINAVGREAGFSAINVHISWDGIFSRLAQGEVRIVASSVTITEERKQNMNFSDPYFETEQRLLLPESSAITSLENLKGSVIGVQGGTTGQEAVNSRQGMTARLYDDILEAIDDLANGKQLGGVVCDKHVAMYYSRMYPYIGKIKLASFSISDTKEHYGFVVRKDDARLLEQLNAGIAAVKKKGVDTQIYAKWFGENKPTH